jgi:integrase
LAVLWAGFLRNIAGLDSVKRSPPNAFSGALSNAWEPGVKVYAKKVLGINTHSLRYARITHMLRNSISPSIVAKITGHKKLDYILTYTQIKTVEEALKNIK